jgi:hypothetical protein
MAVTRHIRFEPSTMADSILVLGRETFIRLSHGHAGTSPGKSALGKGSAARMPGSGLKSHTAMRVGKRAKRRFPRWRFMMALIVNRTRTL